MNGKPLSKGREWNFLKWLGRRVGTLSSLPIIWRAAFTVVIASWVFPRIDWRGLRIVLVRCDWNLLFAALCTSGATFLASTFRWRSLLFLQAINLRWSETARLALIGAFFGTFTLGAAGGDTARFLAASVHVPDRKGRLAWSLVQDRLFGLGGLLMVLTVFIWLEGELLWHHPAMRPLIVALPIAGVSFFLVLLLLIFRTRSNPNAPDNKPSALQVSGISVDRGSVVLILGASVLISKGPKWFHIAAVATFVFAKGNLYWWEPMRWIMLVPPFSSLQSFSRLRLFTQLFFVVGAAWGFHRLIAKSQKGSRTRLLAQVAGVAAVAEIAIVSHLIVRGASFDYQPPPVVNERQGRFYQRAYRYPLSDLLEDWPSDLSSYTRSNIGIVAEPAVIPPQFKPNNRFEAKVLTVDEPGYLGEFHQESRVIQPEYWSPNRITFNGLSTALPLIVNLNCGRPWRNFDQPLFPRDKVVEFGLPFSVMPDRAGRVELSYRLPGQDAIWISLVLAWTAVGATTFILLRELLPLRRS